MASVDPLKSTWTTQEARAFREFYIPLLAGTSLAFCVLAQVLFYIYPKWRVFPRSLLTWLNWYNIFYCTYIPIRWAPHTPWHTSMTKYAAHSAWCNINVFMDITSITGMYVCGTLLCVAIFLMVVRQVDLESKRVYYWSFLATALVVPVLVAIPSMLASGAATLPGSSCQITDNLTNKLARSPYAVMLLTQIVLLGWTIKYIRKIVAAVRDSSTVNIPIGFIYVRFVATTIAQMFNLLPTQYNLTFPEQTADNAIVTRFALVSHAIGPMVDALVMIAANTEFTTWAWCYLSRLHKNYADRHKKNDSLGSSSCDDSGIQLVAVEQAQS